MRAVDNLVDAASLHEHALALLRFAAGSCRHEQPLHCWRCPAHPPSGRSPAAPPNCVANRRRACWPACATTMSSTSTASATPRPASSRVGGLGGSVGLGGQVAPAATAMRSLSTNSLAAQATARVKFRCSRASTAAEFCERGSLADLLARARQDPAAAAALPWPRRLSMVGWGTAAGSSTCFSALGLVPRTRDCLLANTALPAPATCRHLMLPAACCTCTLAPCRCCTAT